MNGSPSADLLNTGVTIGTLAAGASAAVTYQVNVTTIPNPNPISNTADLVYDYIPAAGEPPLNIEVVSNTVTTLIFEPSRGSTVYIDDN